MRVRVIVGFDSYWPDGVTLINHRVEDELDVPAHIASAWIGRGWAAEIGEQKAIGRAPENKALGPAPENKRRGRRPAK